MQIHLCTRQEYPHLFLCPPTTCMLDVLSLFRAHLLLLFLPEYYAAPTPLQQLCDLPRPEATLRPLPDLLALLFNGATRDDVLVG